MPTPPSRSPRPALLFAASLMVGTGVLGGIARAERPAPIRLAARKLPGLEVALPVGAQVTQKGGYATGEVKAGSLSPRFEVAVTWQTGSVSEDKAIPLEIGLFARNAGFPPERAQRDLHIPAESGLATHSWSVLNDGVGLWATHAQCGRRRVTVMTSAPDRRGEDLQRQVVATLRCRPDAAEEHRLDDVPLVMPLPPGWFRKHKPANGMNVSDGKTTVMVVGVDRPLSEEALDLMVAAAVPQDHRLLRKEGNEWPFEGHRGGAQFSGWVTERTCERDRPLVLLAAVKGDRSQTQNGRAILQGARCRKPGEPAQAWPAYGKE
jgi:hypothetical protein